MLVNPSDVAHELETKYVEDAVRVTGQQMVLLNASAENRAALVSAVRRGPTGCWSGRARSSRAACSIVALAARQPCPQAFRACIRRRWWADELRPQHRGGVPARGRYAGRILKGEKPADLPVQAPTKYETGDQPQDRQGARPRRAADAARPRRRGDRMSGGVHRAVLLGLTCSILSWARPERDQ